jgi:hypothetical protein
MGAGAYKLGSPNAIVRTTNQCWFPSDYTPGVATSIADVAVCRLDSPIILDGTQLAKICVTQMYYGMGPANLIGFGLIDGVSTSKQLQYSGV